MLRHERQTIPLGLAVGDNRILEMHGLGHVGPLRKCIWAPNQEMTIVSQTHYQRWFPNTMLVQNCNKAYIIKVDSPAANSIMMLHDRDTNSYMIGQTLQGLLHLVLIWN